MMLLLKLVNDEIGSTSKKKAQVFYGKVGP